MSFVSIAKDFLLLVKGELDPYTTQKSEIKVANFLSVSIFTPAHVQFAAYGRGPGKQPPLDPLIEWVRKKGIVTGEKNIRGAAFAIAKSIGKKGTKNYVSNAPNVIEEALEKHLHFYANKLNDNHIKKTIEKLDSKYKSDLKQIKVSL
jgi:hypothetical protein